MSRESFDGELRDNIYRLKLAVLKERVQKDQGNMDNDDENRSKNMKMQSWVESRDYERDQEMKNMNTEIKAAKEKYEKLKNKLKTQKLQNQMVTLPSNAQVSERRTSERQAPDRFNQYLEMAMVQQVQSQNMLTNQLLLKEQQEKKVEASPYTYPPNIPNYPQMYPPMYPFPYLPYPPPELLKYYKPPTPAVKEVTLKPHNRPPKPIDVNDIYPGNEAQQSLRRLGLVALFCVILESDYEENSVSLSDKFLFDLKIKEIIMSIQRYYLKADGPIYGLLQSLISNNAINLRSLIIKGADDPEMDPIKQELNTLLENLITGISQIMPINGTLGCEGRSLLSELIQTNQTYPDNYFLDRELDLIEVDSLNIARNVGTLESKAILIGTFYIRALVNTILMKPIEYGLTTYLSTVGKDNLRILSSLLVRIYRMILADFIEFKYPSPIEDPKTPNSNASNNNRNTPNSNRNTPNNNPNTANNNPNTANNNRNTANNNPNTANGNPKSPNNNNQTASNSKPNTSKTANKSDKSQDEKNKKILITAQIGELSDFVLTDEELQPLIGSLQNSTEFCKSTISNWVNAYVTKLRPA